MKHTIPDFIIERLSHKNARPKFFPNEIKQFILDYGEFYNYPNNKNLEKNQLLSLWFRYMKSGIAGILAAAMSILNSNISFKGIKTKFL